MWKKWLEDNYVYVMLGCAENNEQRNLIMRFNKACEKHGVSFQVFTDIITDVMKCEEKND